MFLVQVLRHVPRLTQQKRVSYVAKKKLKLNKPKLTMASTAALSGLQGKFPLDPPDIDREHNKLLRTVTGAGGGKRTALVPIVDDVEDLETVCQRDATADTEYR